MTTPAVRLHESAIDQHLKIRELGSAEYMADTVGHAAGNLDQAQGGPRKGVVGRSVEKQTGIGV